MEDTCGSDYPPGQIILTNIIVIFWLALGVYAIWLVIPVLAIVWGVFLAVMFLIVMRRSICTRCRCYGGRCSTGWGWYASKLFKKRNVEEFPGCFGARFAPVLWMSVSLLPVIVLGVSLIFDFSLIRAVILVLLVIVAYLFGNKKSRKKSCSVCRMNDLCPMGIAMMKEGSDNGI